MVRKSFFGNPAVRALTIAAFGIGSIAISGTFALAQTPGFYESDSPDVMVDLSVIDGGSDRASAGMGALAPAPGVAGRLLVPGAQPPASQLYVKPSAGAAAAPAPEKGRVALTPPAKGPGMPPADAPASMLNVPAKKSQPAAAPAAAKPETAKPEAAKRVASAPAEPKTPPAPKVATPAPAKPAVTASAAPPPPAIRKPEAAGTVPAKPAAAVPPPPAVEKPAAEKPTVAQSSQSPVMAVPVPPPAPPGAPQATAPQAEPPKQVASLPKADVAVQPGKSLQVVFEASGSKLTDQARTELKGLLQGILDKPDLRLQLLAYAGGESLSSSKARRLSLSRALAVRSYLIENGLRSTRIDVRALGNKTTEEPNNRVDVNVVER